MQGRRITTGRVPRPDPVDVYVGARVRMRRMMKGFSQERLADGLGVTFQQVQKYEKGRNRIGAARLFKIANLLGVSVSYFFEGQGTDAIDLKVG